MDSDLLAQVAKAVAYYVSLIILMRLAGKRLAGQTTTFDLIVLISLSVVLQSSALQEGFWSACVFVVTVFAQHKLVAWLCARSSFFRHVVRGKPRQLIRDGEILEESLLAEGISHAELKAGLRKLGIEDTQHVKVATLEETGHISAVTREGG